MRGLEGRCLRCAIGSIRVLRAGAGGAEGVLEVGHARERDAFLVDLRGFRVELRQVRLVGGPAVAHVDGLVGGVAAHVERELVQVAVRPVHEDGALTAGAEVLRRRVEGLAVLHPEGAPVGERERGDAGEHLLVGEDAVPDREDVPGRAAPHPEGLVRELVGVPGEERVEAAVEVDVHEVRRLGGRGVGVANERTGDARARDRSGRGKGTFDQTAA